MMSESGKMLPIPKKLQGTEVLKFENLIFPLLQCEIDKDPIFQQINNIVRYHALYTQPFTPSMITEYFEEWKFNHDHLFYFQGEFYEIGNGAVEANILCEFFEDYLPKTLSDFISCCFNSGIKLIWRKQ